MFGDLLAVAALFLASPFLIGYVARRVARRSQRADPETPATSGAPRLSIAAFASGLVALTPLPLVLVVRDTHSRLVYAGLLPGPPGRAAPIAAAVGVTLLGFVMGMMSLYRIAQRPKRLRGSGYAWLGIALSWYVGLYLIAHPLPRARMSDHMVRLCGQNVAWLADGVRAYAADHDGRFPSADSWLEQIRPYLDGERELRGTPGFCGYAYNEALGGKRLADLSNASRVVSIFETTREYAEDGSWTMPGGGRQLLPDRPGHLRGDYYGFADGRLRWLPRRKRTDGAWAREPDADWVRWEP